MQENPSLLFFIIKVCVAVKIQVKNSHSKIFSSLLSFYFPEKREYVISPFKLVAIHLYL